MRYPIFVIIGAALAIGLAPVGAALAASQPLSALTARGTPIATDILPILPSGGSTLQSVTFLGVETTVASYVLGAANTWTGVQTFAPTAVAAPAALTVQHTPSVSTGTTNTAGANTTFAASQGTGTGAGGTIHLQVAPAGSSGTAQNALVDAVVIDSTKTTTFNGKAVTVASAAAGAGLNLPAGAAPTSPVNGDLWTTSAGAYAQINGSTVGPLSAASVSANPSASLGLAAVNGVAATFLRSDGAPALSQAIAPTWTGVHTFAPTAVASPAALTVQHAPSVVAGTSNTAGALLKFQDSAGTGTGTSGGYEFDVAAAGTTGTAQNAEAAAMTLKAASGLNVTTSAQTPSVTAAFSATAMVVNCLLSNVFATTFTANVTTAPTISNPQDGQTINWFITQDATGSRTMTWPTAFKWPGGTAGVLSTAVNAVDLVVATYRSSTGFWYVSISKAFA